MIIRLLKASDRRGNFKSGEHSLDDFFHRHAWNNHVIGISTVYVIVEEEESDEVLGYYALSPAEVGAESLSEQAVSKLPRYPIPVYKIGRLAIDQKFQGKGLGDILLRDALRRCLTQEVTAFGVVVDALNADVVQFYERYSFRKIQPEKWPQPMFLSMQTLAKVTK